MKGDRQLASKMDRFVQGELNPAQARELAQASLDSPEFFDELTDSALARAALYSGNLPDEKVARFPRKAWFIIGSLAAALVLISLTVVNTRRAANPHLKPGLALTESGQPVLLASGLQGASGNAPVFRSPQTDSRAPQIAGSIVSIDDGLANIDLGSLDGVVRGSELNVFRDNQSADPIGRLQVTAVFRERARGRVVDSQPVRVGSRVRVDDAAHLDALLDQVDALYNRGEADEAYRAAEQASGWVESAHVSPMRQVELWNQLAVLRMLRADYQGADAALSRAAASSPTGLAYVRNLNNLGVLAELRGDRRSAESRYADALRALAGVPDPPQQERRVVEANLSRLRGSQ